jgi:hypothetical protein
MLRNISVSWQRVQGGVRIIKVTGAPRVSYWELKTPTGNSIGICPSNTLGILTFNTTFSGAARLFPVTLRGSGYRAGISIGAAPVIVSGYTVTPPSPLSGPINVASGLFTIASNGITSPTLVTVSSNMAGTFSQSVFTLPIGSASQTFTYTPTVSGSHVISFSSALINPSPITYTVGSPPSGGTLILDTQFITLTGVYTIPLGGTSNYIVRHVTATSNQTINFSGTPTQDMRVEIWSRSLPGVITVVETPPDGLQAEFLNAGIGNTKLTLDYDLGSDTWYGVTSNG